MSCMCMVVAIPHFLAQHSSCCRLAVRICNARHLHTMAPVHLQTLTNISSKTCRTALPAYIHTNCITIASRLHRQLIVPAIAQPSACRHSRLQSQHPSLHPWQSRTRAAATAQEASEEGIMEVEIKVGGMMCDGCTSRVAEALQKSAGVTRVEVSLEKAMATCEVKAASQIEAFNMLPGLVEAVKSIGFEAEPHIDGFDA